MMTEARVLDAMIQMMSPRVGREGTEEVRGCQVMGLSLRKISKKQLKE